jgi:hypothetical protein
MHVVHNASVVAQDVQAAIRADGEVYQAFGSRLVRDIALRADSRPAAICNARNHFGQPLAIPIGCDNIRSFTGKQRSHGPADPRRSASDDHDFTLEPHSPCTS